MIPLNLAPKSDQLNADDLAPGVTMIVTIAGVKSGPDAKQALDIVLVGHTRVYRPCLTMRRLLVGCWGGVVDGQLDPGAWTGRRLELYNDPTVRFGDQLTGGLRIKAMSDLRKPYTTALTSTKGKRATWTVGVLPPLPTGSQSAPTPGKLHPRFVADVTALGIEMDDLRKYEPAIDTMTGDDLGGLIEHLRTDEGRAALVAFLAGGAE